MSCRLFALAFMVLTSLPLQASQWHTSNLQLLRGSGYQLTADQQSIITFEHASGWHWGDLYLFVDQVFSDAGQNQYYGEISPRLLLPASVGDHFKLGLIKNIYVASTLEKPESQAIRRLFGLGVDLSLPSFKYLKANLYHRQNPALDAAAQLTISWHMPLEVNQRRLAFEGFMDIVGDEGEYKKPHQLMAPRLLLQMLELDSGQSAWVGVEWQYWHNKFGVDGAVESVVQAQFKFLF